jgi:hypothetical protein
MPVAKPTTLPRWATGGAADIVEPSEGQKDLGWAVGDKPPAQFFNWLQRRTYDWMAWLNDLPNQDIGWAVPQTFASTITSLAQHRFNVAFDTALLKGIEPAQDFVHRLVAEFASSSAGTAIVQARLYFDGTGGFTFTTNARWSEQDGFWHADSAAVSSVRMTFDYDGSMSILNQVAGSVPWSEPGWQPGHYIGPATDLLAGKVFGANVDGSSRFTDNVHGPYQRLGTEVAWLNGWSRLAGDPPSAIWRTPDGMAHLSLAAWHSGATNNVNSAMLTLPTAYRPFSTSELAFPAVLSMSDVSGQFAGYVYIDPGTWNVAADRLPSLPQANALNHVRCHASWPIDF